MKSIAYNAKYSSMLNSDKAVCLALCAVITGTLVANLGIGFEVVFGMSQVLISNASKVVILFFLLVALPTILHRSARGILLFVTGIILVSFTQMLCFPNLNPYFTATLLDFIVLVFPPCACVMALRDHRLLVDYLYRTSFAIAVVICAVLAVYGGRFFSHYSMGFAGALILPINTLVLYTFEYCTSKHMRLISVVLAAVLFLSVLLYGSRGACAAVVAFCAVLFLKVGNQSKPAFLAKVLVAAAAVFAVVCFDQIVDGVYRWSQEAGFESRTLALLQQGSMLHDSGRNVLWGILANEISNDPLSVRGINAEWPLIGIYAHNFILELCFHFGMLIGGLLSISIIVLVVKTLIEKPTDAGNVELLFLLGFIPVALWSGSVWTSTSFWPWLILATKKRAASGGDA